MIREQVKNSFKRVFAAVCLMVALYGTSGCSERRPKGILSEQEMVTVLTEIYVAEEKISRVSMPYDSIQKVVPFFKERIFDKAGIEDSVFRESWNYYLNHPRQLEAIYTALIDSLNLREQGFATSTKSPDALPE